MNNHFANAESLCRSADSLHDQGLYHEAIQAYRQVIETAPAFAPAYNNLAVTLNLCGFYQEALMACDMALTCIPDFAEAYANKGIALKGLGRTLEAESAYRQSLAIRPDQAATYSSLASLLTSLGRTAEAVTAYRQALTLNPKLHEARLKLAMLLLPSQNVTSPQNTLSTALDELEQAAAHDLPALGAVIGSAQPFALAYQPGNHTHTLSRYGTIACRARAAWFASSFQQSTISMPPHRNRIRLLIVSGQISNHSVWNVLLHGLLKHIDRTRFEVLLYNTGLRQTTEAVIAQSLVDSYHFGPRNWVQQALYDQPNVIYYPEIAMDVVTAQLATLRLAPLQLAGWGHPITTGLPTIDLYLSGELIEPPDADQHYCEKLVRLPGTGACSILPRIKATTPDLQPLDIPSDRNVVRFLICQQAAKLDTGFDHLYPQIAKAVPSCRFWFIRDNQVSWQSSQIETRLYRAFANLGLNPEVYLRFIDWLPAEQFLGLLDIMDIYLDTPAFSGYTTAWQALHRGLPVVTLEGRFMRQRLAAGLLRRLGITDTIATNESSYLQKAALLAGNQELRIKLSKLLLKNVVCLDEDCHVVRAFEAFILSKLA